MPADSGESPDLQAGKDPSSYTFSEVHGNHTIHVRFAIDTYTVGILSGAGGSIISLNDGGKSARESVVPHGSERSFKIVPDDGFEVADVLVDGTSIGPVESTSLKYINENHRIEARFTEKIHLIESSIGVGGRLSPEPGTLKLRANRRQTYRITPDTGYHVVDVRVDGRSVGAVTEYEFKGVHENHRIEVDFAINTYTVEITHRGPGKPSLSGPVKVDHGGKVSLAFEPEADSHLESVLVDGKPMRVDGPDILKAVSDDHKVEIMFAPDTYAIEVSTDGHGAVAGQEGGEIRAGSNLVSRGEERSFTIKPHKGFEITDVRVDGKSLGPVKDYTFSDICENHRIEAAFRPIRFTIETRTEPGGAIESKDGESVNYGESRLLRIVPQPGYRIVDVRVDGESKGAVGEYRFSNVTGDHRIEADFILNTYTIVSSIEGRGSIFPAGPVRVRQGNNQDYSIIPAEGYHIEKVLVDRVEVAGPVQGDKELHLQLDDSPGPKGVMGKLLRSAMSKRTSTEKPAAPEKNPGPAPISPIKRIETKDESKKESSEPTVVKTSPSVDVVPSAKKNIQEIKSLPPGKPVSSPMPGSNNIVAPKVKAPVEDIKTPKPKTALPIVLDEDPFEDDFGGLASTDEASDEETSESGLIYGFLTLLTVFAVAAFQVHLLNLMGLIDLSQDWPYDLATFENVPFLLVLITMGSALIIANLGHSLFDSHRTGFWAALLFLLTPIGLLGAVLAGPVMVIGFLVLATIWVLRFVWLTKQWLYLFGLIFVHSLDHILFSRIIFPTRMSASQDFDVLLLGSGVDLAVAFSPFLAAGLLLAAIFGIYRQFFGPRQEYFIYWLPIPLLVGIIAANQRLEIDISWLIAPFVFLLFPVLAGMLNRLSDRTASPVFRFLLLGPLGLVLKWRIRTLILAWMIPSALLLNVFIVTQALDVDSARTESFIDMLPLEKGGYLTESLMGNREENEEKSKGEGPSPPPTTIPEQVVEPPTAAEVKEGAKAESDPVPVLVPVVSPETELVEESPPAPEEQAAAETPAEAVVDPPAESPNPVKAPADPSVEVPVERQEETPSEPLLEIPNDTEISPEQPKEVPEQAVPAVIEL